MEINTADEAKEELWAVYAWWSCILILKMNALTWFTGRIRVARQVIHSEEDRIWMKGGHIILCPTGGGHPDVDRIRAAHRYDLQTVLPYQVITPMWLSTLPSYLLARTALPSFAILSIMYTLMYMEIINIHHHYKIAVSVIMFCILFYMSIMSMLYYMYV